MLYQNYYPVTTMPQEVIYCKFRSTFVWLSGMFPAFRCNCSWFTTRCSSPARVAAFPGLPSAMGRVPFRRPVGSSRTLTVVLIRPRSAGRMREGDFPPLVTPVADEGGFTSVSFATSSTLFMPADFRSKDVARGFTGHPFTPGCGLNSILPADT